MAKARAIVKRRKSVQNIRKITRTMELIATARFKKALDRATEAEAYTRKIAELVADLGATALEVSHPLLETREPVKRSLLLVLTSNRGLAGGYNGNVLRRRDPEPTRTGRPRASRRPLEVAGKRGIAYFRFRGIAADATYTQFEDRPQFDEVEVLAERYIGMFVRGEIDRLDVAYTQFVSSARQEAVVETLLPMTAAQVGQAGPSVRQASGTGAGVRRAQRRASASPTSSCPTPGASSKRSCRSRSRSGSSSASSTRPSASRSPGWSPCEGATENADEMVKSLTMLYNRARQAQITRELAEIIGGAAALE